MKKKLAVLALLFFAAALSLSLVTNLTHVSAQNATTETKVKTEISEVFSDIYLENVSKSSEAAAQELNGYKTSIV